MFCFFKQKTAYEMRISDWSSDVCSSDLAVQPLLLRGHMLNADTLIQHRNVNIIPSAGLRFRISEESELSVEYLGTNNQPNFSQIQPVRNLTNSQNTIIGNTDLQTEFIKRIHTRFPQTKIVNNHTGRAPR